MPLFSTFQTFKYPKLKFSMLLKKNIPHGKKSIPHGHSYHMTHSKFYSMWYATNHYIMIIGGSKLNMLNLLRINAKS